MAIKPTIYKLRVAVSDLNRDHYAAYNLTIAQHPSESLERMTARIMAFCLHAQTELTFTKGLSDTEEPDIWHKTLDDQIELWLEVGEPMPDRVKKASRLATKVQVYSFNSKSDTWWQQNQAKMQRFNTNAHSTSNAEPNVKFHQFQWPEIQALAALTQRTMDWSVTITEQTLYIATETQECQVSWHSLQ